MQRTFICLLVACSVLVGCADTRRQGLITLGVASVAAAAAGGYLFRSSLDRCTTADPDASDDPDCQDGSAFLGSFGRAVGGGALFGLGLAGIGYIIYAVIAHDDKWMDGAPFSDDPPPRPAAR